MYVCVNREFSCLLVHLQVIQSVPSASRLDFPKKKSFRNKVRLLRVLLGASFYYHSIISFSSLDVLTAAGAGAAAASAVAAAAVVAR